MVFLYPFTGSFGGVEMTIHAVNTNEPQQVNSSLTTMKTCPHCSAKHAYLFVEDTVNGVPYEIGNVIEHQCKCASCTELFTAIIELRK